MWECKLNYKKIKMLSCKFRYNSDYINFRKISRHNISIMVQPFKHYISKILKVCTISNFNIFSRNFQCLNYHDEQAEGILRKLRNSQEESPFEHRRRRILNDKKYEGSKGQKNG